MHTNSFVWNNLIISITSFSDFVDALSETSPMILFAFKVVRSVENIVACVCDFFKIQKKFLDALLVTNVDVKTCLKFNFTWNIIFLNNLKWRNSILLIPWKDIFKDFSFAHIILVNTTPIDLSIHDGQIDRLI